MTRPSPPPLTTPTRRVLEVLLTDPTASWYGPDVRAAAGLASGRMHPVLARLENVGWLASDWENVDPVKTGRPRRRWYQLTRAGAQQAGFAMATAGAGRAPGLVAYRPVRGGA